MANFPQAGTYKKGTLTEHWSLAPLPIPTNYPAIPQQINLKKATQTYLDYSKADYWGFEFGIRACMGVCAMIFFAVLLLHCIVLWVELYFTNFTQAFIRIGYKVLPYYLVCVGGMALFYTLIIIYGWWVKSSQTPIRFNREKREVCAVLDKEIIIAPWETVNAQVEAALLITPYSISEHSTLTFFIPDPNNIQEVVHLSMGYAADVLAIAEWEAIRVFMEEGLDSLQKKIQSPDDLKRQQDTDPAPINTTRYYNQLLAKYPEGSPEYFYALKGKTKLAKKGYKWWCFIHFCSGWTLPCHIAAWLTKHAKFHYPRRLKQWSKPIPPEQWAKPSQALLEQSQQLAQAYKKGVTNFQEYFKKNPIKPLVITEQQPPKKRKLPG